MVDIIKIDEMTKGERLGILRRRERLSQAQYARVFGVSRDTYYKWENDVNSTAPSVDLTDITLPEACGVLRRRAGITQKELASILGVSRVTINRMERGEISAVALATYWEV